MDDLNGLEWSASTNTTVKREQATGTGNYYAPIRSTPVPTLSDRSTSSSAEASRPFKPAMTGNPRSSNTDSFSNLVPFGSAKQGNKLTLQEQQEKLEAEKAKRAAEAKEQYEAHFGHSKFWDGLDAKPQNLGVTPPATSRNSAQAANSTSLIIDGFPGTNNSPKTSRGDHDNFLFAAFDVDMKGHNSSRSPPLNISPNNTAAPINSEGLDMSKPKAWGKPGLGTAMDSLGDDDDPFDLGHMETRTSAPSHDFAIESYDDDVLGDLGKPVEEVLLHAKTSAEQKTPEVLQYESEDPWDKAVNELVDLGFSPENSRRALTESGAGLDVQAAVGWLLDDAHRQAKQKAQSNRGFVKDSETENGSSLSGSDMDTSIYKSTKNSTPAWMRQDGRNQSQPRRDESRSPANSDRDISKAAAAVGSNLLKTANSLWKSSQKKVQKAVSDFAQDTDSTQPKWMRDTSTDRQQPRERQNFPEDIPSGKGGNFIPNVTEEALMLEVDSRPPPRRTKAAIDARLNPHGSSSSRDPSPALSNPSTGRSTPVPRWQQAAPSPSVDQRSRLSKQTIEEQTAQAYVSPARRKKAAPPKPADTSDLDGSGPVGPSQLTARAETPRPQTFEPPPVSKPSTHVTPIAARPQVPPRNIPALSPAALASSTQHRQTGTAHFKRGDYASAHASYTSSLGLIPLGHPIAIVLLNNRSLTALKTGDPKGAISDADTVLTIIGPSRGENEWIDLADGTIEGKKPMQEYWGKALLRKAEALEQMECWKDAGAIWREAVEAGVGGATAMQGRQRCEKALAPKPKPSAVQQPPRASPKPKSALNGLTPPAQSTAAVNRLRAANRAAEKADDEKFALSDVVDARVSKWRDGRKDNLRALLGGLDQVLWDGSEWKKVGMHELVVNSKVKIVYMKAISKVHPDKLPQDATTEIKMISASVFATLNEAWDKFKTENGM